MKTHKDLDVWKLSFDLVTELYKLLAGFPDEEKFGLVSQMKRCALSIPSNIAEGAGRASEKEFLHFLSISLGSLLELETQLIISERLGFVTSEISAGINEKIIMIRRMLLGLKKSLKTVKND